MFLSIYFYFKVSAGHLLLVIVYEIFEQIYE